MKKTFTVEIEISEPWIVDGFEFSESKIAEAFQRGLGEQLPYAYESETKVKVVEQSCGTPESVNEKALDLLREACECLTYSTSKYGINLSYKIERFIKGNTIGKIQTEEKLG